MWAVIAPLFVSLFGSVIAQFAKVFTVEGAKWLAMRALVAFVVWVALPIVLYNLGVSFIVDLMSYGIDSLGGVSMSPVVLDLTGLGGWIANVMGLPSAISTIMTAVSVRFAMSLVPFMR